MHSMRCCQRTTYGVNATRYRVRLDVAHSEWLPANLIQAQRDCFGAHTYERVDEKGTFHTEWRIEGQDPRRRGEQVLLLATTRRLQRCRP